MNVVDYGPKPGGPTHPGPTGPNRDDPWPSRPGGPSAPGGPTGPGRDNAEILQDIDSNLVGLLALAYFGPAEQGTARSVDQVCAAEVLLFRLRAARAAVRDLADAFNLPARRTPTTTPSVEPGSTPSRPSSTGQPDSVRGRSDGTGKPPAPTGERLAPGYGAVSSFAVAESGGARQRPEAGAQPPTAMGAGPVLGLAAALSPAAGESVRSKAAPAHAQVPGGGAPVPSPGATQSEFLVGTAEFGAWR